MSDGIFPEDANIYIVPNGTNGSDLVSSDRVETEVTNFSESGGEQEVESLPVFGNAFVDKTNPRSQIEVSFDVLLQHNPSNGSVLKWDDYKYGSTSGINTPSKKSIFVEFSSGSDYYTRAYNNARAVSWNPESGVEDNLSGSITFNLSPSTNDGVSNFEYEEAAATDVTWG